MENTVEPKETIEDSVDAFLDKGQEAPAASSPAEAPSVPQAEDGSDPVKTPSTPETAGKTLEKELGPVPYDKFQEAIRKRQEADKALENERKEKEALSRLLDDPDTLKRYLQRQGYSDYEIRQELQRRGMPVDSGQKKAVTERVLERMYGDKLKNLKPEDLEAIKENMGLVEAVTREILGEEIQPLQRDVKQREAQARVDQELSEVEELAKTDGIDFEKEAIPAMQLLFDKMAQADPRVRKTPPSARSLYNEAVKQILLDRLKSNGRQEERDERKSRSKPITPHTPAVAPKEKKTFKSHEELDAEIDSKLDALGYRG